MQVLNDYFQDNGYFDIDLAKNLWKKVVQKNKLLSTVSKDL